MRKTTPGPYIREVRLRRDEITRFDQYPFALPAVRHLDVLRLHPKVTFLVGELDEDGLRIVTYRETEHFFVTHEFLKNPDRMLRQLLGETDVDG